MSLEIICGKDDKLEGKFFDFFGLRLYHVRIWTKRGGAVHNSVGVGVSVDWPTRVGKRQMTYVEKYVNPR